MPGHEAAERIAEHDRLLDAEHIAESPDVVTPLVEGPQRWIAMIAASVAAMVEGDHLGDLRQRCEGGLEHGMIDAGPPCSRTTVGRSRMRGPSCTSFSPWTSKNSRAPLTITCIESFLCACLDFHRHHMPDKNEAAPLESGWS
jgi:hypothetical protein